LGYGYSLLTLLTELISVAIVLAIMTAFIRRFLLKVPRLQGDSSEKIDAVLVLSFIFIITMSLIGQNTTHFIAHGNEAFALRPISHFLSQFVKPEDASIQYDGHGGFTLSGYSYLLIIYRFRNISTFIHHDFSLFRK